MPDIEIFRAGTHTALNGQSITFSTSDLQKIAALYDTAVHLAPLVVGHPQTDAPAYGWVQGLRVVNDRLVADAGQLDPAFTDLVRQGRFKKVSASFYTPEAKNNPSPGQYALRHVGFLGAQPPAVKGLKEAQFQEDSQETVTFTEEMPVTQEELDARQKKLEEREAALQATAAAFAEQQATARLAGAQARVDTLIKAGKVLPRLKEGVMALLASFQPASMLEFAEGTAMIKKSPDEVVFDLLESLPQQIAYGEISRDETYTATSLPPIHPSGYTMESGRAALHVKAISFMEANKMDISDTDLYVSVVERIEKGAIR